MHIHGNGANSRPGAGCPGKPYHLYICEYIHLQWESKQPAWGGLPVAALPCPSIHACRHINRESKQPARGGLHGPAHYPSIHVHISITHGTTSSLLGAACLGQPYQAPIHIHLYIQSSRPGAGCLGPIISLCMCIHTYTEEKASSRPGGGLPRPAPTSLYICAYVHMKWASKQPVWGGLPGATLPYLALHALIHRNWDSSRPGAGCPGQPQHLPIHVHTYIYTRNQ